ncbi:MAG: MBL fold metallo-hydrolase [Candidatus Thorarchaeota archaeon]
MSGQTKHSSIWSNDEVEVKVPYSAAGVGTTVVLTSRFTGKILLMDVGDGALRDLLLAGNLDFVTELDIIAITHGHFDHVGGLWTLLGFLRMLGRTEPVNILVPTGCTEVTNIVKGFKDCYFETLGYQINIFQLQHGSGFDTDFFKLKAMGVEHYGSENVTKRDVLMPALGYRVLIGETMIAYTGDSRMCKSLEDLVADAHLAVIEATYDEHPNSDRKVHLTEKEAKKLGKKAKEHLLIHMKPDAGKEIISPR